MTAERCVICHATIPTTEGGLCDDHKYDDEVFCPRCFAGTESNEHREKCSEPILRATDDYPSSDPLAELLWRHRQFDNDDDGLICGCGAADQHEHMAMVEHLRRCPICDMRFDKECAACGCGLDGYGNCPCGCYGWDRCDHDWLDRPESDSRECLICGVEVFG